jgi:hypothetical protein
MKRVAWMLMWVGTAAADPKADYAAHMKAGDAAENGSKWDACLTEFEAALVAKPGDPRALAEVGFCALQAGKAARAKEASEAAILSNGDAAVRASAMFNLSMAVEKDDPFAAASLYLWSYMLRPNATVDARLTKLEKGKLKSSDASTKLLATLKVDPLDLPRAPKPFPLVADHALEVALAHAGVAPQGAAGKQVWLVDKLACTKTGTSYACSHPKIDGDFARAIVVNLEERKVTGTKQGDKTSYTLDVACTSYTEGDGTARDHCEAPR